MIYFYLRSKSAQDQNVFLHQTDYEYYLRLLERYKESLSVLVYGFCLLPTESYVVLSAPSYENIIAFWQILHDAYGDYFKMRYNVEGPIWQRNFNEKSTIKNEHLSYFLKFIESIPVEQCLCTSRAEYPWSSYSQRIKQQGDRKVCQTQVWTLK